jgi:choline-sulfatase
MAGRNVLILVSDEHLREAAGCYGGNVHTPNLDKFAQRGTRFTQATTPSPICVPARASLATGRYVHDIGFWSNAQPYDGSVKGWGHRLIDEGYRVVSIGKLHYRCADDDNGFDQEIIPLHVKDGVGWARGLLGRDGSPWGKAAHFAEEIGPGLCDYNRYDMRVCEETCRWLKTEAPAIADRPWVLYASFVSPHYPLIVPERYYDLYPLDRLEPPRLNGPDEGPSHPVVQAVRSYMNYDDYFDDHTRLVAKASFLGLCSFLDDHIGQVLAALEDSGQLDDTVILYTSDHGDLVGNHGMWTKCCMYEESAAIPMLAAGPGIPSGAVTDEPVSLVDIHQTVLQAAGLGLSSDDLALPGRSLIDIANGARYGRTLLSEYHDGGSITGMFMIKHGRWKYTAYPGYAPELYDLENDPFEARDLGQSPAHADVRTVCDEKLRAIVDPDAANKRCFADQAQRIAELGGRQGILDREDFDQSPVPV